MKHLILLLLPTLCFCHDVPKNIHVGKMGGFELFVSEALKAKDRSFAIVLDPEQPGLRVQLGKRVSGYGAVLYTKQTGRKVEDRLTVVDSKTKETILHYDFLLGYSDESKRRDAERFAELLLRKVQ